MEYNTEKSRLRRGFQKLGEGLRSEKIGLNFEGVNHSFLELRTLSKYSKYTDMSVRSDFY